MSIFALADLHLSGDPPLKPMDRFSPAWENHWDKIRAACHLVACDALNFQPVKLI